MATSFYGGSFFGGEFFNEGGAPAEALSGGGHYTPVRHFTPLPEKKKQIDFALQDELRVRVAIHKVQESGTDKKILDDLYKQLETIQKLILMFALESRIAYDYIQVQRQIEDEEISVILSLL